jgi:hypothetical protein
MNLLLSPVFASAIWIGGGGVGLLLHARPDKIPRQNRMP